MNSIGNERLLAEMLNLIIRNPGIRPSELNRRLGRSHSAHYRGLLIKRGLVRKERSGSAVRYYPVQNETWQID